MKPGEFREQLRHAEKVLKKADVRLAKVIASAGPCTMELSVRFEPFEALLRSICHQQLTGKAAETILGRVHERVGKTPDAVQAATHELLRGCGLSNAKALAVRDLAQKTLSGIVPKARELHKLEDSEVIERLTEVRGVGQWTVEMMLMFRMGRLDVLPADDYGVRKGFTKLMRKKDMLSKKELLQYGERWRPYRSVASWYMWRALEL